MAKTRDELLHTFAVLRRFFAASMVSVWFLNTSHDPQCVGDTPLVFKDITVAPYKFANKVLPISQEQKDSLLRNFVLLNLRAVIANSYGALKTFGGTQEVKDSLRSQDWYRFLAILRGSLDHSDPGGVAKWRVGRYLSRGIAPVTWRGKTIDASLDTKPIEFKFFAPEDSIQLLADAEDYVEQHIPG